MKQFIYDLSMSVVAALIVINVMATGMYFVLSQWLQVTYAQSLAVVVGVYLLSIIWNIRFDTGSDE